MTTPDDTKVDTIDLTASLTATISLEEETSLYVSYCPALNLCSQGDTIEEAKDNIAEATELFIETCFECGTLNEVLKDCGFYLTDDEPQPPPKRESPTGNPELAVFQFSVLIPLITQKSSKKEESHVVMAKDGGGSPLVIPHGDVVSIAVIKNNLKTAGISEEDFRAAMQGEEKSR